MKSNRREFLKTMSLSACLAGIYCRSSHKSVHKKPNIILCMADDQGWGDMGYNGHPVLQTPNFDAMAKVGLRFDRFYAAAPVCSPTRASVMTGRHPNRMGCFQWGHTLRPQEITIAEKLKAAGYVTGHFGKWHLGSVRPGDPVNPGASGFDEWFSAPNFFDNDPILSREGKAIQTHGESSLVTANAAIEFIRKQSQNPNPFFAVVWFGSPHSPHQTTEKYRKLYPDHSEELQHFYGEITAMDHAFGQLKQELKTLGIRDNTVLWYCSDNGGLPRVGSTGGRGHKNQIYEGGLRVPAILEWPEKITQPMQTSVPCVTSDIYPTLCKIVGIQMENQPVLDGINLVPLLEDKMKDRPKPIGFWKYPIRGVRTPSKEFMTELLSSQQKGLVTGDSSRLRLNAGKITKQYPETVFPGHSAWIDWPWKLHRIEESGQITVELYDLEKDAQETINLAKQINDRTQRMMAELEQWLVSVVKSLNGEDY